MRKALYRFYEYKKTFASAIAAFYAIWALSGDGFTSEEALASQTIVFGVIAVYLAANEPVEYE